MVTSLKEFQENAEEILEEAQNYDEPVVLRTGLGNFFIIPERDYMGMMSSFASDLDDALSNIK